MSLFELGPVTFGPSEDRVSWLRRKGLLSSSSNCTRCSVPMVEGRRQDVSDGLVWRCRQCKGTKSIREGSFFSKSKLPLRQWVLLMHFWVRQYPVTDGGRSVRWTRTPPAMYIGGFGRFAQPSCCRLPSHYRDQDLWFRWTSLFFTTNPRYILHVFTNCTEGM